MSEDQHIDEMGAKPTDFPRSEAEPITPDDSPSALERGARIFERLRRRP